MTRFDVVAQGLAFPEGPVVLPDGSLLVAEIGCGQITHIDSSGHTEVAAKTGGGPNGAALGPDGALYVCNNGGFEWHRGDGLWQPIGRASNNRGGSIQRIELASGRVDVLYTHAAAIPLVAPNDLVIDAQGGIWFTDHGHREGRRMDIGAVFHAACDGSAISEVAFPLISPNGIGLSPDGSLLYVAETSSGRLWSWPVLGPGKLGKASWPSPTGGELVCGLPGFYRFDSLAVEADGNIAIATLRQGGICVVSPRGELVERVVLPDPYTTNICFGGKDMQTAWITLSGTGRLVSLPWTRRGLEVNRFDMTTTNNPFHDTTIGDKQ